MAMNERKDNTQAQSHSSKIYLTNRIKTRKTKIELAKRVFS
jgi:hypothetical protein